MRAALTSLATALAFAAAAPRASADRGSSACVLQQYTIGAVAPHLEDRHVGGATTRRVRGAEIFVIAERGLTAEWLRAQIDHYRGAHHKESPDCVLDLRGADVSVAPRGPGFTVTVRSADDGTAKEILRRARALRPQS